MKSVLISIQPKWCELIANGRKTIEVRKTKPKLETPFKCYIYMSKDAIKHLYIDEYGSWNVELIPQKIIGEFVCYAVTNLFSDSRYWINETDMLGIRMTSDEIKEYAKGANRLYGWHISDLVIYDEPKELSDFATFCKGTGSETDKTCKNCRYLCFDNDPINGYTRFCGANKRKPLTRPPQSWCYVEKRE